MTTIQRVYISHRDPTDELGETYIIIGADIISKNLTGGIREIEYLFRKEIIDLIGTSSLQVASIVNEVKTRMDTKYKISSSSETDREIISQLNSLVDSGNLRRDDLGNLVTGTPFFESYVGVYENSTGIFQTTSIVSVSYQRTGGTLVVTLNNHNLIQDDVVNIENPAELGFNLTNFIVKNPTTNTFEVDVTATGTESGSNMILRIPEGTVANITKYKVISMLSYERFGASLRVTAPGHGLTNGTIMEIHDLDVVGFRLTTGFLKNSQTDHFDLDLKEPVGQLSGQNLSLRYIVDGNITTYDVRHGLVSRNDIGPSSRSLYSIVSGSTIIDDTISAGDYFLIVSSGTLRTGVYSVDANKKVNRVDGGENDTSHILRSDEKIGGILDYIRVVTLTSSGVELKNSLLEVTFGEDHGLDGDQLLFTSLSPYFRLRVSSIGSRKIIIHSNITIAPVEVKIYFTESRQSPQTIERYTVDRRILVKTLREIRNPNWNPAARIILPGGLDEDAPNDPGVQVPSFTSQDNFNKFILNSNGTPQQKYQLIDLQSEVFGSVQRAVDGLRLNIDTSKVARNGVYREYYPNGHMRTRSYYRSFRSLGVLDGPYEEYFENGETRVSYQIVPYHPYNILVPMSVVGKRILIQLNNHNVQVGDTVVLNNSTYVVEDCPNSNLMYISPPILSQIGAEADDIRFVRFDGRLVSDFPTRRDGGDLIVSVPRRKFVVTEFLRETGYFQEFIESRFVYIRQGTILTVIRSQHGLKIGDAVSISNPKIVKFSQTHPTVLSVTSNTFILSVSNSGNRSGRDLVLIMPSSIRKAVNITDGLVESSEYVSRDTPRAVFGASVIDGSYVEFHKTLAFKVRCTFDKGVIQGELVQWDEEGNREYVAEFDRGDLKNGVVLNYTFTY